MTNQPIEPHEVHSQRLIQHAEEELDRGDRLQASEKAWGTVVHYFKVLADRRGWRYRGHSDAHQIAEALAREQRNSEISELYRIATELHTNYYLDAKYPDEIRRNIGSVNDLLRILREIDR